jgi:8-oxo-dGTP diphosphatase
MTARRMVAGFMFDPTFKNVLLIRKDHPAWQAGKLNGIGGKLEQDETPRAAMVREFKEECGIDTSEDEWNHYETIVENGQVEVDGRWRLAEIAEITFWWTTGNIWSAQSLTSEPVMPWHISRILEAETVPNLGWLVLMALDTATNPNYTFASTTDYTERTEGSGYRG